MYTAARTKQFGSWLTGSILVMFVLLTAMVCFGQEYRATVTGTVTDSSKAIIPDATVSIRNLDTNEVIQVKANAAGAYTVPFLHPGHKLEVSAEAPGFKKSTFPPIVLGVSQTQTANFALEVGGLHEVMTVNSDAYEVGLDTAKADRGSSVDNKTLTELPLNGRSAVSFFDTLAGITDENGAGSQLPATDMYYSSQFTINGGATANIEFTIDGQPNNASPWYNNGPSAIPSIDALQELKVVTSAYDAQQGRTAGGVVSMELKSGTNAIHGAVYEFAKRTYMDANTWVNNFNGTPRSANDHKEDQYGLEVAGPVYIPHIYDGRNKTFFMFSWEKYKEQLPQFATVDLPNPAWLLGDFSQYSDNAANCINGAPNCLIPVYDPATRDSNGNAQIIKNSAGQYNKVDPSRFNPIAVNLLNSILATPGFKPIVNVPNQYPWETLWADTIPQQRVFNHFIVKGDQILGSKDHLSINFIHQTSNNKIFDAPVAAAFQGGQNFKEYHFNGGLDWVHTFSSTLLLDFHANYQRYWRTDGFPSNFSPAKLGFDPGLVSHLPSLGYPQFEFAWQQTLAGTLGNPLEGNPFLQISRDYYYMPDDTYSYAPTITKIQGKHTLRFGVDVRLTHESHIINLTNSLSIESNGSATSQSFVANDVNTQPTLPDGTPLSNQAGNPVLDFLLSQPDNATLTNQKVPYTTTHYFAPWVQDDWKVTPKLTLNLGLRYDLNGPATARNNAIDTGFNFNAVSPIDSTVNRAVDPTLPKLLGGYIFPTPGRNTPFGRDYRKIQPRIGFAYQLGDKTVVRGGFGRLVENPPMGSWLSSPVGFSTTTPYVNSPDGRTFFADNLTNPFANNGVGVNGGIPTIPGASLGLATDLGQGAGFINPNFTLPYVNQFSFGVQRATPKNGKLEVSYVGSRSYDLPATLGALNENIPLYESCDVTTGTVANPDPRTTCTNQLPNPFQNVPGVTGALFTNATVSMRTLSRPHPQFGGISETQANIGKSWYNSMQTTYTQRMSWAQVNASWTWSKSMQSLGYVDQFYKVRQRTISGTDRKNRITLQSVLDIPVGRGRTYFSGLSWPLDALVGGWQLSSSYFWESGNPIGLPSGWNLVGNIHGPNQNLPNSIDLGINDCREIWRNPRGDGAPGAYVQDGNCSGGGVAWRQVGNAYHAKVTEQPYSAAIRAPTNQQLDTNLSKHFKATERINLELRLEMFNVLNHPTYYFGSLTSDPTQPGFGTAPKTNPQSNRPRVGQLGVKVTW